MTNETIVSVMDVDWDVLIILDACRYDYFANSVKNYFSGRLEKRISLGSCTPEWLNKNFTQHYSDIIYISGNPYVSSKIKSGGFNAKEHFHRIIDVWAFGWDKHLSTVHPQTMCSAAVKAMQKYPEKKFIIHFVQPHAPYIIRDFFAGGFQEPFAQGPLSGVQGIESNKFLLKALTVISIFLVRFNIMHPWDFRERLGLPPASPMDATRRMCGVEGLRAAYQQNLDTVLYHVVDLYKQIIATYGSKNIVVTADHGEFLGEGGKYSHPCKSRDPVLVEIPWFKIENVNVDAQHQTIAGEQNKIKQKLYSLKKNATL